MCWSCKLFCRRKKPHPYNGFKKQYHWIWYGHKQYKKTPTGKNDIRSIFICKDQNIWVCTYSNGFSLFKNGVFYKMPNDSNNFLTSAHGILEDTNQHFWISTNKGLIEVNKKACLTIIKQRRLFIINIMIDKTVLLPMNLTVAVSLVIQN